MKAYKVELLIIDFDGLGAEEIKVILENSRYANYCISPDVKSMTEKDIGEWSDDHKLNSMLNDEAYKEIFGEG